MIQQLGDALLVLTAVLAWACLVAYQVTTGGAWARSATGRHLMAFMAAIAAVTALGTARAIAVDLFEAVDPAWFRAVRVGVFASVPVVLGWRLALILSVSQITWKDAMTMISQYRKYFVALAGALVTAVGAAADAADVLPIPDRYRPWAAVLVALATALGVHQTPNAGGAADGRHEAP